MKFQKSRLEPLKIELGGIKYPIRVTFDGMAEFEEKFNMPYLEVFNKLMVQDLTAKEVQFILFVLLKGGKVEVALEDLDDVDFSADILGVMSDALLKANQVVTELAEMQDQADGDAKKKTETA